MEKINQRQIDSTTKYACVSVCASVFFMYAIKFTKPTRAKEKQPATKRTASLCAQMTEKPGLDVFA